ncbi:hypothetical protein MC885_000650, partial [Smutsia gigantea]
MQGMVIEEELKERGKNRELQHILITMRTSSSSSRKGDPKITRDLELWLDSHFSGECGVFLPVCQRGTGRSTKSSRAGRQDVTQCHRAASQLAQTWAFSRQQGQRLTARPGDRDSSCSPKPVWAPGADSSKATLSNSRKEKDIHVPPRRALLLAGLAPISSSRSPTIYSRHTDVYNDRLDLRGSEWDIKAVQPGGVNSTHYCHEYIKASWQAHRHCPLVAVHGHNNKGSQRAKQRPAAPITHCISQREHRLWITSVIKTFYMTSPSNDSTALVSEFLLICFPNYQTWRHWLSLPLSLLFLLAMGANATLLLTTRMEASLHQPVYYLLGLLSLLDMVLCLTVIPKVLAIFWFDLRSISFSACFLQMFIMNEQFPPHGVLHHFVTIRHPPRLRCCAENIIKNWVCTNLSVSKLSCDDITSNRLYQFVAGWTLLGSDLSLTVPPTPLSLSCAEDQGRRSCSQGLEHVRLPLPPHPLLQHRPAGPGPHYLARKRIPPMSPSCSASRATSPPAPNPIVYGARTKRVKQGTQKWLRRFTRANNLFGMVALSKGFIDLIVIGFSYAFSNCGSHVCVMLSIYIPALFSFLTHRFENVIENCICANLSVSKLSCDNVALNKIYQLIVAWTLLGSDLILIFLSYTFILQAVLRLKAKGAAAKALSTCGSHFILILFFSTILLVFVFTHMTKKKVSPDIPVLLNVLHHVIPAGLNPIVYGVRTQEIKQGIWKFLRR